MRSPPRISPEVLNVTGIIMPPDPIQTLGCTGGTALVFSLDASNSIVGVEFAAMQRAVRLPWHAREQGLRYDAGFAVPVLMS